MTKHRSKPRHIESGIQAQCVKWIRTQYPGLLCYAVPNGGKRSKVEAMIMQGEGVTPGIPDLHIAGPGQKLVVIEMKAGKNGLTPEQRKIQARFTEFGFPVYTCWSLDEFMAAVRKEFGMGPIARLLKSVDDVKPLNEPQDINERVYSCFPTMEPIKIAVTPFQRECVEETPIQSTYLEYNCDPESVKPSPSKGQSEINF